MSNDDSFDDIEEFIKNLDISLAELERTGATFLSVGYAFFAYAANVDIHDLLINNNTDVASAEITLQGQQLVLLGYIFLWVVAIKRIYSRNLRTTHMEENINVSPYVKLANAYLLSTYANTLRLEAFTEIANSEESEEEDGEENGEGNEEVIE
ncbi:MAG: hypothetical protein E6300_10850 [Clostridium sp.]|uniref:hypothetical protein n=1 Tax=Clostridium sp. TaxID=1506 RepID=UPI001EC9D7E9|nr:hypothetical protein [Clostridium sp.]MBS5884589.1 hypothetical protein [Clostridium sp.]MDU7148977.1 hypothetical protein [Clostridium sp.]MDU7242429.1 hypothetical protein [Clostridium sp.]